MERALVCPECGRGGFKRLTRHFSQVHGLSKEDVLRKYPGIALEIPSPGREVRCVSCGERVEGYSGRAANVKCARCRETPAKRRKGGDTEDLVACRVCGLQRRRLGRHIKAAHGLSVEEYREGEVEGVGSVEGEAIVCGARVRHFTGASEQRQADRTAAKRHGTVALLYLCRGRTHGTGEPHGPSF